MKKEKVNHIGTILITLFLTFNIPLYGLAASTESGALTIQEQWANNVYQNYQSLIQDSLKVSIPNSELDNIWNEYIDHAYNIWNLNENDLQSHYGHFRNYVGSQFEMEKNADNTYNYNMSEDARTFIQDSFNTYLQENPLNYTQCYIYSYNYIDTSVFSNIAPYNTLKEFIKNADGYVLVNCGNYIPANSERGYRIYVVPKSLNMGLYGTVTGGVFTNVQMSINWLSSQNLFNMSDQIKTYYMDPYGNIREGGTGFSDGLCLGILNNNSLSYNSNNKFTMFTNMAKNEPIYVYATLNAYKAYNSGSPQAFYMASGYNGIVSPYGNNIPNTQGSYESIINNIQTGWTAQEVLALVDRIMLQNGGSGSGSGDNSSDNPFAFLGKIGEIIGNLVNGIGNLIVNILDGISNAFLGEDGNGGIIGLVSNVLTSLTTLISEDFANFINGIFSFMPDELRTVLIAGFTISVFLGVLKMIRK